MPRLARLDAPGLLQHVMARGIERGALFKDNRDRESFLERLAIILEETQTQCYAWSLMSNHFHLLIRTGATPLSKVMRRLMTGYAVTFNKRHKRSGHLFQNRYKSIVCEEDVYLLELIRYIHLNPIRSGLITDLKELDRYPWTYHSAILGKRKNPLIPRKQNSKSNYRSIPTSLKGHNRQNDIKANQQLIKSSSDKKQRCLAEKALEDVLLYFGKSTAIARRRYRDFIKKGISKGSRPELQGGGLVRSAGGNKAGLLGRRKEEREDFDPRILGSGDFVTEVLKDENDNFERKAKYNLSLSELIDSVCSKLDVELGDLMSRSRKREISKARAVVCYLAVNEFGYVGEHVGRELKISGKGVSKCVERGKVIFNNSSFMKGII